MKSHCFLVFAIFMIPVLNAQRSINDILEKYNSGNVPYMSVEELRMHQLDDEVIILDAREMEEYQVSHIEHARYIGYNHFDISGLEDYPKDSRIVVYCSLGVRSEKIAEKLREAGYENVWNLYGGIFYWKNTGYDVVDSEGKNTDRVHAYSKQWSKWLTNAEKIY